MKTTTVQRSFPESEATLIHQTGAQLSEPSKGVEIVLHTRENENEPCCAEVISGEHYAEIGLSFEGKELTGYDGVFFLPRELGEMLMDGGYAVPEDCFA
ncbi:MAG: hypothetical protein RIS76_3206 [Verrucomicrobiota bacterium]|jgi:hypothetical protein